MRFLIALVVAIASSNGVVVACPLVDVLKLCVATDASINALAKGAEQGDWTVKVLSSPPDPTSRPVLGSGLYTMPSGLEFFISYRDYKDFFSSHCELNFVMALAKGEDRVICTSDEFKAFETALSQTSVDGVTKVTSNSGTAFLLERPNMWVTVVLAISTGEQKPLNVWVETSKLKK